jgi:hypothetical protein
LPEVKMARQSAIKTTAAVTSLRFCVITTPPKGNGRYVLSGPCPLFGVESADTRRNLGWKRTLCLSIDYLSYRTLAWVKIAGFLAQMGKCRPGNLHFFESLL